ncbi:MAG: response regulator [Gammaproteobacteria bacterium]|nr:response regulator [Gammaproteobacteria bacterium]MDH5629607.1 response regulator [Gammaproteobacteria bacterium]
MNDQAHILIVDDEPLNVEIIQEILEDKNFQLSFAENGEQAIQLLEAKPDSIDVVLLDRMMPKMGGMEVLKRIKQHPVLRYCPVIFQTAKSSSEEIAEGLNAGAHYYLTKPFNEDVLMSVIGTAIRDRMDYKRTQVDLNANTALMKLMEQSCFKFKTIAEARNLAGLLSHVFPEPNKTVMGLTELMVNAVEHGNLKITYDEKTKLNETGKWESEVVKRLDMPKYKDKFALVTINCTKDVYEVIIEDQGNGFDYKKYLDFDPNRVMDNHGRGIAMANNIYFSEVEYQGRGNIVHARIFQEEEEKKQ